LISPPPTCTFNVCTSCNFIFMQVRIYPLVGKLENLYSIFYEKAQLPRSLCRRGYIFKVKVGDAPAEER
ncbi:hypothetical protein, partial [uncultured Helicobacter sp.]|uniref:hypothetical protein n=1 Tax=uncultured Helicobacter sp. TaxID=175537 RepID=UPI0026F3E239